jgi:RNA polymerase sigma-70 factor (ECF subfamily)
MLAGDEMAFEQFADQYLPPLYRFAQRLVNDPELARDLVQSTLCKAIAKLGSFRGEAGLATWLCACCLNEIASHYRRLNRAGTQVEWSEESIESGSAPDTVGAGPEQALLSSEQRSLVHAALDELPPHYAHALEWKYLDRVAVDEIALRLELSPKAAESLLSRARQAFRERYERLAGGSARLLPAQGPQRSPEARR